MASPPASPDPSTDKNATATIDKNADAYHGTTWEWVEEAGTRNSGNKQQTFWHLMTSMHHPGNREHNAYLTQRKNFGKFAKSYKRKIEAFELYEPFKQANRVII